LEFLTHLPDLTNLSLTLMLTLLLPHLMERLHLPGPIGYILAGIILGPNVLAILNPDGKVVNFFADLGKLLLMFFAGFEIDVDQFNRARRKAVTFGLLTFATPFLLAVALGAMLGYPLVACAVIGAVLASHTLLGLATLKKYDLMGSEPVVATVGATVFTDMLAILILAICLPIHVGGVDPVAVGIQLAWLAVYVPGILFGLSAVAKWLLRVLGTTKAAHTTIVLLAIAVAAQFAEWIGMEGIIGAFLAGVALKRALGNTKSDDSLEVISHSLFIPVFFITAGFLVDFKLFFFTLRDQPLLVVGVLGALFGGKWLAAQVAGRLFGYRSSERALMFALTVPQVAATIAVALVAYATINPAGERLIDRPMLNATVVLVIVSAVAGLILTERAAKRVVSPPTVAPSVAAS